MWSTHWPIHYQDQAKGRHQRAIHNQEENGWISEGLHENIHVVKGLSGEL